MKRHHVGAWGEEIASQYLEAKGYTILARNWRTQEGEVDLVAQDGETVVFVEVKTRTSKEFGWSEESITLTKRRRLQRSAMDIFQIRTSWISSGVLMSLPSIVTTLVELRGWSIISMRWMESGT